MEEFKAIYKKETREKLSKRSKSIARKAIDAVFASWNNPRAIKYRQLYEIKGLLGTAVNVQAMVFGNMEITQLPAYVLQGILQRAQRVIFMAT